MKKNRLFFLVLGIGLILVVILIAQLLSGLLSTEPGTVSVTQRTDWLRRPEPSRIPLENPVSPTWPELSMDSGTWEVRFMNGLYEARPWGIQRMNLPDGSALIGDPSERTVQLGRSEAVLKWSFVSYLEDQFIDRAQDFPPALAVSIWDIKAQTWTRAAGGERVETPASGEVPSLYFACDAEGGGAYLFSVTPGKSQSRSEVQTMVEKVIESLVLCPRQEGAEQQRIQEPVASFFLPRGWNPIQDSSERAWQSADSRMNLRLEIVKETASNPKVDLEQFQEFAEKQFQANRSDLKFEQMPEIQVGSQTFYRLRGSTTVGAGESRETQMVITSFPGYQFRLILFSVGPQEQTDSVIQLLVHTLHLWK